MQIHWWHQNLRFLVLKDIEYLLGSSAFLWKPRLQTAVWWESADANIWKVFYYNIIFPQKSGLHGQNLLLKTVFYFNPVSVATSAPVLQPLSFWLFFEWQFLPIHYYCAIKYNCKACTFKTIHDCPYLLLHFTPLSSLNIVSSFPLLNSTKKDYNSRKYCF